MILQPCEFILHCLWFQDVPGKQRESDLHIAHRLQKKVTKRAQFLENVASSKRQASLAVQGGLKKKRQKDRVGKRLGDLSQLAASLREASQLVSLAPNILTADSLLHASSAVSAQSVRGVCPSACPSHTCSPVSCRFCKHYAWAQPYCGRLIMSCPVRQDESRAALSSPKRSKGLGVGGTRKRLRIVEHESKRLQQVGLHCAAHDPPLCYTA